MWFVSGKLLEQFFAPPIQDGDFKRSANNFEQIEHVRTVSAARQQVTELLGPFGASFGTLEILKIFTQRLQSFGSLLLMISADRCGFSCRLVRPLAIDVRRL
jgi:hypothetical protein